MSGSADLRRIVVLNDDSVARGGAAELALASVRAFRQRDIPVTFIAGDDGDNPELVALDVAVVALGERKLLDASRGSTLLRGLYNRRTLPLVRDWIDRHDDDGTVYHLHTWTQILSPAVFQALAPVRDRLLVSAHDYFLVCPNGAYVFFGSGEPCALRPLSVACILGQCDRRNYGHKLWRVARQAVQSRLLNYEGSHPRVLALHQGMRPLLERGGIPAKAIETLPNPIRAWSATRIPAEQNREFVFVGRLDEEKGPDLAARAARRAGVPLRIIGDGPMMAALRTDYPEVIFSGRQSWEVASRTVRSARVLVMPSRYPEPFGLVAGEALWSGIPVLAADKALMAPDIVARRAGLSCDPRDEEAMAIAMRTMAGDDAMVRRMSLNAFEETRDLGLTPDAWIGELLRLYRGLGGGKLTPKYSTLN